LTKIPSKNSLRIIPVRTKKEMAQFIHLPWTLYADDPAWIPPLVLERKQHLSSHNPFFAHAEAQFWMAFRNNRPVGRISAQINHLHQDRYNDATGFFGFLEAEDNPDCFQALFEVAEGWLRQRGITSIRGPFNLSINDECGLLVEGFSSPPQIMMGHALPYYAARVEDCGYSKVMDLLAYHIPADFQPPPFLPALFKKYEGQVRLRPLNKTGFKEDIRIIRDIFEDAWSENWGFVPFTDAEFLELGKNLKLLVDDDLVRIAEVDGEPAAMMVVFPNINEAIADLNGRLLPLGWLKLLWRIKVSFPSTIRVPLMGVRKKFQKSRLGAALALMMITELQIPSLKRKVREAEMSWILEDNVGMRKIIESIGGEAYKRYRIFQKDLS